MGLAEQNYSNNDIITPLEIFPAEMLEIPEFQHFRPPYQAGPPPYQAGPPPYQAGPPYYAGPPRHK
jgi:hypothetical protein